LLEAVTSFYDRRALWVGSAAALAVVVLGLSLALWQLRRADEKSALQAAQERAAAAPALELATLLSPANGRSMPSPATIDGARVQAGGTFDAARSVFLDNRTREGVAGLHVLTPLQLSGTDRHVLVLRGWTARDPADRNRLPPLQTPPGPVRLEGRAVADLPQPMMLGEDPVPGPGDRLWQHFGFDKFARWSGLRTYPLIVRQTVEPDYRDGLARDWNQPGTSVDRHRGYAFQWFALSAAAVLTWLALLWRSRWSSGAARTE
jgi:cytochrome oxidase assembly protein ShyY1